MCLYKLKYPYTRRDDYFLLDMLGLVVTLLVCHLTGGEKTATV